MASVKMKDGDGGVFYGKSFAGTGTSLDPHDFSGLPDVSAAAGADAPAKILNCGGTDGSGDVRALKVDASTRALLVGLAAGAEAIGTVSVSGTVPVSIASLPSSTVQVTAGGETIGAVLDAGPLWTCKKGISDAIYTTSDATGASNWITEAPGASQKLVVDDFLYSVASDVTIDLLEETSGTLLRRIRAKSAAGTQQITLRNGLRTLTNAKRIRVYTASAVALEIEIHYHFIS